MSAAAFRSTRCRQRTVNPAQMPRFPDGALLELLHQTQRIKLTPLIPIFAPLMRNTVG